MHVINTIPLKVPLLCFRQTADLHGAWFGTEFCPR
jgi:hypothetical protein